MTTLLKNNFATTIRKYEIHWNLTMVDLSEHTILTLDELQSEIFPLAAQKTNSKC